MRKLLFLTFTIALLSLLSVNTFAQWGKTITVATNHELIEAIENPAVEVIQLEAGYYEFLGRDVSVDTKVIKSEPSRTNCNYIITTFTFCYTSEPFLIAQTNGDVSCAVEGHWTYSYNGGTSGLLGTATFDDDTDPGSQVSVTEPGIYIFRYTWYDRPYYLAPGVPDPDAIEIAYVEGDHFAIEIPTFEVSYVEDLCEDECFNFEITITRNLGLPFQARAIPPFKVEYSIDGGTAVELFVTNTDEIPVGSGIYKKQVFSEDICDWECGQYSFEFKYIESARLAGCGGVIEEREVFIYDEAEFEFEAPEEVCGLIANFTFCEYLDCIDEENYVAGWSWEKLDGGFAPDPIFTKLNGNGPAPVAVAPCEDEWRVEVFVCGTYEFTYTVINGPCESSTSFVIDFYDKPLVIIQENDSICGLVYDALSASYTVECPYPAFAEWAVIDGPEDVDLDLVTIDEDGVVTVPVCGAYEFSYTVSNGFDLCTTVSTVIINFYDIPYDVSAGDDTEVCDLEYLLQPTYTVDCPHPNLTAEWTGPAGVTFDPVNPNLVTVPACGEYTFTLTVRNGFDECIVTDQVTIKFYLQPIVYAGPDTTLCLVDGVAHFDLLATVTPFDDDDNCMHPEANGIWRVKTPGPCDPIFEDATDPNTKVTFTCCGDFELYYTFWNNDCDSVASAVWIKVYDEAEFTHYAPEVVCGYVTDVYAVFELDCPVDPYPVGLWSFVGPEDGDATITETGDGWWNIVVDTCGVYTFYYSVTNGPCTTATHFTINFYEEPKPEIQGPPAVLCAELDYTVVDGRTCGFGEIAYFWTITGFENEIIGDNTGTTVTVRWASPGTLCVQASLVGFELTQGCFGEACIEVVPAAPIFAGQVKYWNQFETFMPTPYPTYDYATYPHDYFYVELWNGESYLAVTKVEPTLKEVQSGEFEFTTTEFMSYFEFDLEAYIYDYGCEGYYLKIWDGGLYYHWSTEFGGTGVPVVSGTHLGANYTYNNWGGVNATDALAVQMMATGYDVNSLGFNWIGLLGDSPRYGYYSHSAADVNSSNPYVNGGITALDALTTNYRAVGLIDVFPNNYPGVFYSPNFRVTGRMVDHLTYTMTDPDFVVTNVVKTTFPDPFDYDNDDDVPFTYPLTSQSYLYFTDAWLHKYTSDYISLSDKNYIHIYYLALGDLNSSHVPTSGGFKAEPAMALRYDGTQVVNKGEVVTVPIRIDQNAELGAISLVLSYNTSLIEVLGVDYEEDFYMVDAEAGILRLMWYSLETPANFAFGEAIANVQVRILGNITADTRFFELEANTELADRNAQPFKNINLETTALSSVGSGLFMTNYPNPFRSTTMISYNIPEAGNVSLVVYNKLGQVVETLVSARQDAGTYQVEFGRTDLTPGAYFYRIIVEGEANTYTSTNSMIFMQ